MNKDLEFLLAIIIFLLVVKNICGKNREKFGCDVKQCSMDICNSVMKTDSSSTTGEIVGIAMNPNNKYHNTLLNLTETLDTCKSCGDIEEEQTLLDLSNNFKNEPGVCQRKSQPVSSFGKTKMSSGNVKKAKSSGGSTKKKSISFGGKARTSGGSTKKKSISFGGKARTSGGGCRSKSSEATDAECQKCEAVIENDYRTLNNPLCKEHCTGCR